MICQRCIRTGFRNTFSQTRSISRTSILSSTPKSPNAATQASPRPAPPGAPHSPSAATSTSAAQSFGTPHTRSEPKAKKDKTPKIPKSSIPAGMPLKGLNLLKGKTDPLAMEDKEYPPWLWTLLVDSKREGAEVAQGEGDLYAKSAKQRRKAAKALRKKEMAMAASGKSLAPAVPLEEQSIDLPAGDSLGASPRAVEVNLQASAVRQDVTKALRKKRRAKIKEMNFLKGMS
ncbi:54S ribosomal protein L37, mitochondrial [Sphaceloma murrayae]|uniref:Large ribosomal subunit protein mL54 n=1 Tax=Sphaceloma murrayae TaxID=2082308 RepID=A0A2K1QUB9_9PEZI|nr:54S ribosomal protein L37, mitochondrial [Sphaceloma murrayae]